LILVSALVLALMGAGVLGFTAVRRASLEHPSASASQAPISMPVVLPAPAPEKVLDPPTPSTPAPARTDGAKADVTMPRRVQSDAVPTSRATPPANRPTGSPTATRGEQPSLDAADGTAAIDWLLKTSRAKGQ
jgi:hypothetical protein